ncbi:hypothetical protein JCM10450v2_006021 [Rhodotorula kratochvilovae]
MGFLVWHDWARLLALTSGIYVGWAAIWALFYRKYFWDFVGATLGPTGLMRAALDPPPPSAAFFVKIIVDIPLLQMINLLNALFTLVLEWPLPPLKNLKLHQSIGLRVGLYLWSALAASFVYQTAFPALFYLITALAYARSLAKGESLVPPAVSTPSSGKV